MKYKFKDLDTLANLEFTLVNVVKYLQPIILGKCDKLDNHNLFVTMDGEISEYQFSFKNDFYLEGFIEAVKCRVQESSERGIRFLKKQGVDITKPDLDVEVDYYRFKKDTHEDGFISYTITYCNKDYIIEDLDLFIVTLCTYLMKNVMTRRLTSIDVNVKK